MRRNQSDLNGVAACLLLAIASAGVSPAIAQMPGSGTKPVLCLVPPDVHMAQGVTAEDASGSVVNSIAIYLSGPAADVQLLQARIPVQFNAEAAQRGCGFIVQSKVVQKKSGSSMSGLLTAVPAIMNAVPFVGGASQSDDVYAATQAANAAMQGIATVQEQNAEDTAVELSSVAQNNIKKGDQIIVTYKLLHVGTAAPPTSGEVKAKAEEAGQDILSPLLEQMANDVLTAAMKAGG